MAGTVVEVNTTLKDRPEAVNTDPYASWMIILALDPGADASHVMDAAAYDDLTK
jgi:glycine cleavage system H protein